MLARPAEMTAANNGVSQALALRTEFATIIQRNGGRLEGLLATMRKENYTRSY
jgi:hypothetical protein